MQYGRGEGPLAAEPTPGSAAARYLVIVGVHGLALEFNRASEPFGMNDDIGESAKAVKSLDGSV